MKSHSKTPLQVEGVLLGLLAETPMHGYDLYKLIRQPGGLSLVWRINQSNLYAVLEKFVKEGYLTSEYIAKDNSHPRRDFHITPKGLYDFKLWIQEPVQKGREMRQLFMAKLYFALKDGKVSAEQLIKAQIELGENWKSDIQSKLDDLSSDQEYEKMVLRSRSFQVSAWLQFLEQCQADFIKTQ